MCFRTLDQRRTENSPGPVYHYNHEPYTALDRLGSTIPGEGRRRRGEGVLAPAEGAPVTGTERVWAGGEALRRGRGDANWEGGEEEEREGCCKCGSLEAGFRNFEMGASGRGVLPFLEASLIIC